MPFDLDSLLVPISDDHPCGEALDSPDNFAVYNEFRRFASSTTRPDWARYQEQAITLAQTSRDLRAWVWLTRTSLCAEGITGFAAGLQLIAEGLQRYWDLLPPQDLDEMDPRERFMSRLSALTQLGVTNFRCSLDQLQEHGRVLTDLYADLDVLVAKATPDASTRQAIDKARTAIDGINKLFSIRFGADHDPQLGFDGILGKLSAIEAVFGIAKNNVTEASAGTDNGGVGNGSSKLVKSREDVVRVLDLVLDYYNNSEPSSPVPLLVQRAKRLVPLSFMDAIRDLAPTGLKELQAVTGSMEEKT